MAFTATATKAIPAAAAVLLLLIGPGARRAAAFTGSDRGDPRLLPLRFHGDLLGRNARRQGRAGMPQAQPRQSFRILQNGGERDYTGPSSTGGGAPAAPAPSPSAAVTSSSPSPSRVKPAAGAKPTPHPTAKLAPSAPPAAAAGPATATATPPPAGAPETSERDGAAAKGGAAHSPHLRGRPASACAGVPPGGGRIIACLMRNQAALSPLCKNALAMAQARKANAAALCGEPAI